MDRIHDFELPDAKLADLEITVVTPQIRFSGSIVSGLVDAGIRLSQIAFMLNPDAECADTYHSVDTGEVWVTWCDSTLNELGTSVRSTAPTVDLILGEVLAGRP
jgi:hypothetical protein